MKPLDDLEDEAMDGPVLEARKAQTYRCGQHR
jgi:hypothetical protein